MDDLFRKRLQNFEAQPPMNGFKPIHKTLLRRKWMKYLSVGGSALTVVTVISSVIFWHKSNSENFTRKKVLIEKEEIQIQEKVLNNSSEELIYYSEVQKQNTPSSSENQSQVSTESDVNLKESSLSPRVDSKPKNITQNHKKVSPENSSAAKVENININTNQNLISINSEKTTNDTNSEELTTNKNTLQSDTQSNVISSLKPTKNPRFELNPILPKNPVFNDLDLELRIDSAQINLEPLIRIPRRNPRLQYTFYAALEWRTGDYDPYQTGEDSYMSSPSTRRDDDDHHQEDEEILSAVNIAQPIEPSSKSEYHFEQRMADFGIRAEYYLRERVGVYWTISMTQLQETYQEKYTQVDYPIIYYLDDSTSNLTGTGYSLDSLDGWGRMLIPNIYESTEELENKFSYIGISQGFIYDIIQRENRNLRLNLEIGTSGLLSGSSTYFVDGFEIDYQNPNLSSLMFHWRTGLEFRQRLSENWSLIGGAQFRGFWNDESAGGILQGVQIGLRWR